MPTGCIRGRGLTNFDDEVCFIDAAACVLALFDLLPPLALALLLTLMLSTRGFFLGLKCNGPILEKLYTS